MAELSYLISQAFSIAFASRRHVLHDLSQTQGRRRRRGRCLFAVTPGLHNKISAYKIFARGWVAQICFFSLAAAKIFQGLGPKRRESSNGDRV